MEKKISNCLTGLCKVHTKGNSCTVPYTGSTNNTCSWGFSLLGPLFRLLGQRKTLDSTLGAGLFWESHVTQAGYSAIPTFLDFVCGWL